MGNSQLDNNGHQAIGIRIRAIWLEVRQILLLIQKSYKEDKQELKSQVYGNESHII